MISRVGHRAVVPGLLLLLGSAFAGATADTAFHQALAQGAPPPRHAESQARGRQLTRLFFAGALDSVHAAFRGRMADQMSLAHLSILHDQLKEQLGPEVDVLNERVADRDSVRVYTRLANFEKATGIMEVVWELDAQGWVTGFFVRQPIKPFPTAHQEYRTKTPLRLPFRGSWFVVCGGRSLPENFHAVSPDQRFACDFVLRKDGAPCSGDCSANEQHFAFGQPVLAPAPGKIVAAMDGVADNVPGQSNARAPLGNYVVIDHGDGEFSFLAHLQSGSLVMKVGQKVRAGDVVARCGNSGISSLPHLHYHLQTTAAPLHGDGLPAFFLDYTADGKKVESGEARQMQTVAADTSEAGPRR